MHEPPKVTEFQSPRWCRTISCCIFSGAIFFFFSMIVIASISFCFSRFAGECWHTTTEWFDFESSSNADIIIEWKLCCVSPVLSIVVIKNTFKICVCNADKEMRSPAMLSSKFVQCIKYISIRIFFFRFFWLVLFCVRIRRQYYLRPLHISRLFIQYIVFWY